jgi:hypothetical protein
LRDFLVGRELSSSNDSKSKCMAASRPRDEIEERRELLDV